MITFFLIILFSWCFLSAILLFSAVVAGSKKQDPGNKTQITYANSLNDFKSLSGEVNEFVPSRSIFEVEIMEYIG